MMFENCKSFSLIIIIIFFIEEKGWRRNFRLWKSQNRKENCATGWMSLFSGEQRKYEWTHMNFPPCTRHTRLWFDKITFQSLKIFFFSTSFSLNSFDVIELSWGSRNFSVEQVQVENWERIRRQFQDLCNGKVSPMQNFLLDLIRKSWAFSIRRTEDKNSKFPLSWNVVCLYSTQHQMKSDCIANCRCLAQSST